MQPFVLELCADCINDDIVFHCKLRLLFASAGNPLFGWWELGSAIIGDVSVSSPAADFSPCTPHRSEATETKSCDVKL